MSTDLFVDVLRFPNLVGAADLNRIIPPSLSLSTRTLLEFQIQHIFLRFVLNNLRPGLWFIEYHTYHADSHSGITWMGVLLLSSHSTKTIEGLLLMVTFLPHYSNSVCQDVTAQGGDVTVSGPRLSAESQLTLHSGTPSVGPEQWPVCQVCAGCVCREPGDAGN